MKPDDLVSCDNCAVVLDAAKLCFPDQKHWINEDGEVDVSKAVWTGTSWKARLPCPVCGSDIVEPSTQKKVSQALDRM